MNNIFVVTVLVLLSFTVSCKSGSSKKQNLANSFVKAVNADTTNHFILKKVNTRGDSNIVVIYDHEKKTYDAYDLTNYQPGDDVYDFLDTYQDDFYFDLIRKVERRRDNFNSDQDSDVWITEVTYTDYETGIKFSKKKMQSADTAKAQEVIDQIKLTNSTDRLVVKFGLPSARAKEVAGLTLQLGNTNLSTMTVYQYDQYSKAILGTTIGDVQSAIESKMQGDGRALDSIYESAAASNGISKSSAKKLAETFFH